MALYKYNGVILREGAAIAASEDCCCGGPCCEFTPCELEGEPVYYLCDSLPEGIQVGDIIEIGDECFEYTGEVDCVGDEVDGSFGDTYETCDECECPCIEFVDCDDEENTIRYKYCKPFDPVLNVGDVVLIDDTCYELTGGVACENDETELTDPDVYETCNDCTCVCFRGSRCGNPNSTLDFKVCGNTNGVGIGDIIRVGVICYTITQTVSCVGVTEQENRPIDYANCTDCCPRFKGVDCLGESEDRVWRVCDPVVADAFKAASVYRESGFAGEPLCICFQIEETDEPVTEPFYDFNPIPRLFDSCEDCYIPGFCAP